MILTQIYNGIKRLLFGSTSRFTSRKGSSVFNGSSWSELYRESMEYPTKIISVEILVENEVQSEFRLLVDGEKIFPFSESSNIKSGNTLTFLLPVEVAANSFFQLEVRGSINSRSVVILSEMAIIEVI